MYINSFMETEIEIVIQKLGNEGQKLKNLKTSLKIPKNSINLAITHLSDNQCLLGVVNDNSKKVLFFKIDFNFESGDKPPVVVTPLLDLKFHVEEASLLSVLNIEKDLVFISKSPFTQSTRAFYVSRDLKLSWETEVVNEIRK